MKIMFWNCRGLGGTSTVSQLKEYVRLYNHEIIFLCETEQTTDFIRKAGKQLKCDDRWAVREPIGKNGGLFVAWDQRVEVKQIWTNEFCIEMRISSEDGESDL